MVKVNYDSTTGEIKGFYPDFVKYEKIPEPTIDVTEDIWHDCIANIGLRKVDLTSLSIVTYALAKTLAEVQETEIAELKTFLAATDYQAIKFLEGQLTAEDYASMKVLRENWRVAINKLQTATTVEEVEKITYERYVEEG